MLMSCKNYILFFLLCIVFSSSILAQKDVPSDTASHTRPLDQFELGFAVGASFIAGDVPSWPFRDKPASFKSNAGIGGAITLRKALSHTFSIRGGYLGAFNQGEPNPGQ